MLELLVILMESLTPVFMILAAIAALAVVLLSVVALLRAKSIENKGLRAGFRLLVTLIGFFGINFSLGALNELTHYLTYLLMMGLQ